MINSYEYKKFSFVLLMVMLVFSLAVQSKSDAGQLMIIAAHIPIVVEKPGSELGWWNDERNTVSQTDLINELQNNAEYIQNSNVPY